MKQIIVSNLRGRHWRVIPKISYTNWKRHPQYHPGIWTKWLSFQRFWSGKIIQITVRHHNLCLDFRYSWLADLRYGV